MKILKFKNLLLIVFIGLCSCATYPVLYPNEHYNAVGENQSQTDINNAMSEADSKGYDSPTYGKDALQSAGAVAVGAGTGAAIGAFTGGIGLGAIVGAIGGFGSSIVYFIFGSPDHTQLYKNYVDLILRKQGYEIIGWK